MDLQSRYGKVTRRFGRVKILSEHTHLVICRHTYKVERVANLFKGAAAKQIIDEGRHPLAEYAKPKQRPPRMWAAHAWKVYLNSEEAIENTIHYVEDNREKENKVKQKWDFVTSFAGIQRGGWTTYSLSENSSSA